jgi:hypothetical protein
MDVVLEILRWTSLIVLALIAFALLCAPFGLWISDFGPLWLLAYVPLIPLSVGAVFLIAGIAHGYWPNATGDAEHCGEGTHYVTYHYTTYVLSGKVIVPVTETDWKCVANG